MTLPKGHSLSGHRRKWLIPLLAVGILFGLSWVLPIQQLLDPETLTESLRELGMLGPLVLTGLMTLAVVVSPIPSLPIDLAAGATYGPWWGGVYVLVGAELGAVISFMIGRSVGRNFVEDWMGQHVVFCEKCSDHHLWGVVALARLLPIFSFDIVSYGAGLTRMSLRSFALATLLGMIPPTFAFTYFGSSLVVGGWPVIVLSLLLISFFLAFPQWILKHRSSDWVRWLQGESSSQATISHDEDSLGHSSPRVCDWCGSDKV